MTTSTNPQTFKVSNTALAAALGTSDTKFDVWQKQLTKSNDALHEVMQEAYEIGLKFSRDVLLAAAKDNEIKYNKHTMEIAFAVKLSFRKIDRQQSSVYSLVIEKAKAAGIAPANLPKWIKDNGGIEKIRTANMSLKSTKTAAENDAAYANAKLVIDAPNSVGYNYPAPPKVEFEFPVNSDTKTAVWHVRQGANGSFDVISIHTDTDLVKSIGTKYGKALKSAMPQEEFPGVKIVTKPVPPKTTEQDEAMQRAVEQQ